MTNHVRIVRAWLCISTILLAGCAIEEGLPALSGPYLGQDPPGLVPEVFAPGIISTDGEYEGGAAFSPDGRLFLYKRYYPDDPDPEQIWASELSGGIRTAPERVPFDGEHSDWDFNFTPFGRMFYFTSRRPALVDGKKARFSIIWRTQRTASGRAEPQPLDPPVNSADTYSGYPSLTTDGGIHFHSERDDGMGDVDIYQARPGNRGYGAVENLGSPVNSEYRELDPAIAPDESCLVFVSNRPSEFDLAYDLYISFRTDHGAWSEPQGLGGALGGEVLPVLTADGRYFFFAGGGAEDVKMTDIYWADAGVFDQFRPERTKE